MSYRTRTEIITSILEIANRGNGITKTKIMYGAFLSHSQMKEYLTILTDNGLISYDLVTRTFKTTDKGHRFLQVCNGLDTLMKEERA
ncbi:MAG TPA: winged helix-turn-helix domain-containing protein [Nitrososphaeraceae archaeon]|nr:winged helix-turn-helix domain-containing protein [Nitrososphaeraceae archaeon]